MQIRRAENKDLEGINKLLYQVAEIHASARPDIFKPNAKKYTDIELLKIIACDSSPIFVAVEEDKVLGYAFCIFQEVKSSNLLQDKKTLYIDDICVDKNFRGQKIGCKLYDFVLNFAKEKGFDDITLNVWAFNQGAYDFYKKRGMQDLKITMQTKLR